MCPHRGAADSAVARSVQGHERHGPGPTAADRRIIEVSSRMQQRAGAKKVSLVDCPAVRQDDVDQHTRCSCMHGVLRLEMDTDVAASSLRGRSPLRR